MQPRVERALARLPSDYEVERSSAGVLAVHRPIAESLRSAGYGSESSGGLTPSDLVGRRPMQDLVLDGVRYVVRDFAHGGLLRWFTGERFLDPARPFRELILSDRLIRDGLRTPRVVAARARRAPGGGWLLDVVTRRIEEVPQFLQVIEDHAAGTCSRLDFSAVLRAVGACVREFHDAGLDHADLNPRNLLVERRDGIPRIWVVDLDRSVRRPALGNRARAANLERLLRFVWRLKRDDRRLIGRGDLARFLRSYEPSRKEFRGMWRAVQGIHGRGRAVHAAGRMFVR